MKKSLCLVLILGLAAFLRIYHLADNPPALNWDEVSHGYNAYSILKTGKDEWGQFLPLANFRAYGDYPLPANLYLTIPSISLFGLNEFGIRFPHAFLGTLTILSCFFLVQGLGFSVWVSLIASLLVAIDPWVLFPSRFVVQSNVSLFFITTGLAFFFNRKKNTLFLPLSALFLGVSVYSYHNARIFIPLFVVVLASLYQDEWKDWWRRKKIHLIATIILLLIFLLPLVPILLGPGARARAHWVSIIDQGAINQIIESRLKSNLPSFLSRLVYNRPVYFLSHFILNYIGYFTPKFLFFDGGTQYQFSIPGKGVLYPVEMPFFYLGFCFLVFLALVKRNKSAQAIFLWLLLAPIPAAVTRGGSHLIRASTILPVPQILTAFGFFQTVQFFRQKKWFALTLIFVFLLTLLVSILSYLKVYFGPYRQDYSWSWQYGYKELVEFLKPNYDNYDKIIITKKYGEPHEFVLFWWPWDPSSYHQDPNKKWDYHANWYWVDAFDKFVFVNDWEIGNGKWKMENGNFLLITSPENYPEGWNKIKTIDFLDGQPAFDILERK